MAFSNSYDWMDPDPFKHPVPPIWKEKIIGEIQYYYKNILRPNWLHSDMSAGMVNLGQAPFTTVRFHFKDIDPSGENIIFSPDNSLTEISSLNTTSTISDSLHTYRNITVSGFVPDDRIVSNGSQIRSADASWAGAYCKRLKETREFIEGYYGQNWAWIAPSSQASLYNLSMEEATVGGTRIFTEPPHPDFIRYLREVPDSEPQDWIASTVDYSSLNSINGSPTGNTSIFANGWLPMTPSTAPNFAREAYGEVFYRVQAFQPGLIHWTGTWPVSGANCGPFGQVGGTSHTVTFPSLDSFLFQANASITLPFYKRATSLLPSTQGLPLYTENTPSVGFKGMRRNGPALTSNSKIVFGCQIPTISIPTVGGSLANLIIRTIRRFDVHYTLSNHVLDDVQGDLDEESYNVTRNTEQGLTQYSCIQIRQQQYDGLGALSSDTTSLISIPTGKFTVSDLENDNIEISIIEDYPTLKNCSIELVSVAFDVSASVSRLVSFGTNTGSITLPTFSGKGINLIYT